ncbi:MAG: sortase [Coriobacteriia bacterium]|nr:sortase [Coriobacteriia bacterium]
MPQTALPVGGAGTHSVLVGHRGLPASLLFTDLGRVSEGDQFLIHVLDHTLAYEVDSIRVVLPEDIAVLAPQAGEDLMTLATCTPLGVNSHRLLIRGHRVPYATQEIVWPDANTKQLLIAIGICLIAAILIALRWWQKKRKEKRDQVSVKPVSSDPLGGR